MLEILLQRALDKSSAILSNVDIILKCPEDLIVAKCTIDRNEESISFYELQDGADNETIKVPITILEFENILRQTSEILIY